MPTTLAVCRASWKKNCANFSPAGSLLMASAAFAGPIAAMSGWSRCPSKGRGFARAAAAARMTDIAGHLVDHFISAVSIRQFVLSLPHWLPYRLAYDHERCSAVLSIFIRALLSFYRNRAKNLHIPDGRTGSVTFIQRFGSAVIFNIHLHVIVLDGVFSEQPSGELTFQPAPPPTTQEVARLLATARTLLRGVTSKAPTSAHDPMG